MFTYEICLLTCNVKYKFIILALVAQAVKNPPAMQETRVRSPCREDPLEKGMATHSSILALGAAWTEESGGIQPMGVEKS